MFVSPRNGTAAFETAVVLLVDPISMLASAT